MTTSAPARGVVFIHSSPRAMCQPLEWVLSRLLGTTVRLDWVEQPVAPGTLRSELSWAGRVGLGADIVSTMRGYPHVRFEVTEEPTACSNGQRFVSTPSLGLWTSPMGTFGETFVSEERLRAAVADAAAHGKSVMQAVEDVLGTPWDRELEPFRYAGDGVPVRWLHQVG